MAYFSASATERTRAIKRDAVFIEFAYERDYCEEKIRIQFHRFHVSHSPIGVNLHPYELLLMILSPVSYVIKWKSTNRWSHGVIG